MTTRSSEGIGSTLGGASREGSRHRADRENANQIQRIAERFIGLP